jgi:hypothetical protein
MDSIFFDNELKKNLFTISASLTCATVIAFGQLKSNLIRSGATSEPFWSASVSRTLLRAKLRTWVPVWFFITDFLLSSSN